MKKSISYGEVMEVYRHPISVKYIPHIFVGLILFGFTLISKPVLASATLYIQVPQWSDDWSKCAVDVPDTACHWYVAAPDNTFGKGFSWKNAPWFDANGLKDISKMKKLTVLQELQNSSSST